MPKQDIITKELILHSADKAGIDVEVFLEDIKSSHVTTSLKCDQHISNEMDVNYTPTLVFFNENFEDEGLKVEGIQNYSIYTYIISELMDVPIEKNYHQNSWTISTNRSSSVNQSSKSSMNGRNLCSSMNYVN